MRLLWKKWFPARPATRPTVRLSLEAMEDRSVPAAGTAYLATDLVADQPGIAPKTDATLVNAWGISLNPNAGAFWISSAETGFSEVYAGDVNGSAIVEPFTVDIPHGAPTGQVFNAVATDFIVSDGTTQGASAFIFASETGFITGWNIGVGGVTPGTTPPLRHAQVGYEAKDGAVYKGLALARVGTSQFLYATDFHNGKIDVFDSRFQRVTLGSGGFGTFTDPNLPKGYAPFGVAAIGGKIYVSYAKQDADAEDDVAGHGNGFVSVFDTAGNFQNRLISRGKLNSPWGMVQATANFGDFSNALLVGNFGDGRINAYDISSGNFLGTLSQSPGRPLEIEGLWGLAFGNGRTAGDANSLYYAAGPNDEEHGLFGKITANAAGTNPVKAAVVGSDLVITGSRNDDVVQVFTDRSGANVTVRAGGKEIGTFPASGIGTIRFNGLAGNDVFLADPRLSVPVIADGGAGNDLILGGGSNDILLGNTGNDILLALGGRDILIGGDGSDILIGTSGDDILVAGRTSYDANTAALLQIQGEWTSNDSYDTRVSKLRAGTGGLPKLDSANVFDDGVRDDLIGGTGLDWFLAATTDRVHGKNSSEQVN